MTDPKNEHHCNVVIVGAGLAGLCCARALEAAGKSVRVYERSDAPGGRVRTDRVDGFLVDRGFQVLLTAYPTLAQWVDLQALDLRPFAPGAKIFRHGRWETLSDPLRRPSETWRTLTARTGTLADKVRVLQARVHANRGSLSDLFHRPETSTAAALQAAGFSEEMQDAFWRPFLRGVMLDPSLSTSSRFFEFVLRMFSGADVAVPAMGMEEIPKALAAGLRPGTLRCHSRVLEVHADSVELEGGERCIAEHVVIAADPRTAARWLGEKEPTMNGGVSIWFAADAPPLEGPWLLLNGQGHGRVNHVAVMSEVSRDYAPRGQALICVNQVGVGDEDDSTLIEGARDELQAWFGACTSRWKALRVQRIPEALPAFLPPTHDVERNAARGADGIWVCGDHCAHPSLEGAAVSGVGVAEAILRASD